MVVKDRSEVEESLIKKQEAEEAEVEISVTGEALANLDLFSKSDPFVVASVLDLSAQKTSWREIGRTETLWDNLNPRFMRRFVLNLAEPEARKGALKLDFYDRDKKNSEDLSRHSYIGTACFTVPEILRAKNRALKINLKNGEMRRFPGRAIVRAELRYPPETQHTTTLKMSFGPVYDELRARVFYEVSRRSAERDSWTLVHRSDVLACKQGRSFEDVDLQLEELTAGLQGIPLRIELLKKKAFREKAESLGCTSVSYEELKLRYPGTIWKMVDDEGYLCDGNRQLALFESTSGEETSTFHLRFQNY